MHRKSNLGRRTRRAEAARRLIAKLTEEERASANEQKRQRIAKIRAEETSEQRSARLEDARLRARRSRATASDLLRSQQNKRIRLRMAERYQRETANQIKVKIKPVDYHTEGLALINSLCEVDSKEESLDSTVLDTGNVKKKVEDCTVENKLDSLELDVAIKEECEESHWGEQHKQS